MKALVLEEPGCMTLQEVPRPQPGPGEVLIQVKAATTCGTDLKAYRRGHPQIPMPGLFGHEYSGVVVATGDGAPFAVGDAVMGVHSAPCQQCFWCQRGQENLCESIMATKVLGSYSEYLLVPERIARLNLFSKPDSLTFEVASLLEPLACVAQGIQELDRVGVLSPPPAPSSFSSRDGSAAERLVPRKNEEGVSVLVIGPGAIGLMFVAALKLRGVEGVTLAGRNPSRLEVGRSLGATTVPVAELAPEEADKFDIVIECTGMPEVWEQTIGYVRRGGTVMLFGGCPGGTTVTFDTKKLHYDQITLLSPFHFGTRAVRTAREWLLSPQMDLSPLISGRRTLDEGKETFADLQAGRGIKYVFQP